MTKFEDAIAAAKVAHYDDPETVQLIELIVAQNERVKNLEHSSLEAKSRLSVVEAAANGNTTSIASLTKSRDENDARVKVIEGKPDADTAAIADLDKRVTAVEGAVGSKAFKKAEAKTNGAPAEPKPHFWEPAKQPEPATV